MGKHDHHHHHHGHHHGGHQDGHHHRYGRYGDGVLAPPAAGHYHPPPVAYPLSQPYGYATEPYAYGAAPLVPYASYPNPGYQNDQLNHAIADHHRHSRNEHLAEAGAVAAGAFAMYEAHEAKVDPAHAGRHKMEAGIAGAVALGSAAYALHEHHEKKKDEHLIASLEGHHGHGHRHHHHHHQHGHGHHHGKQHHF